MTAQAPAGKGVAKRRKSTQHEEPSRQEVPACWYQALQRDPCAGSEVPAFVPAGPRTEQDC